MGTIRSVFSQINWARFFNVFRPDLIGTIVMIPIS